MIRTLKIKFMVVTIVLVSFIILGVFFVIYHTNARYIYDKSVMDLKNISTISLSDLTNPDSFSSNYKKFQSTPIVIVSLNNDGKILSQIKSNISIDDDSLKNAIKIARENNKEVGTISDMEMRYYIKKGLFYEKISFIDISRENRTLEALLINLIISGIATVIVFFIIDLLMVSKVLKPVAIAWEQQKQFIADASHELKTPITVLLANMDILEDNKDSTIKEQMKWINSTKQEAIQMKNLIEEMLFLAKTDAHKIKPVTTQINISDILISQILSLEVIAFEKNVQIIYDEVEEDVFIKANEKQIVNLIIILLENAIKYCYENTNINVTLKKEVDKIKMEINNMGPIIPKEDLSNIFERFYRVEKSRNKEHGGYGLGLSIAKKIAQENNLKIMADSNKQKGTTFKVIMNRI